ncbi:vWA domain-containing protein [Flaviaesturariibacter terrae]
MIYDWIQQLSFAYNWMLPFVGLVPVLAFIWARSRHGRRPSLRVSTAAVFRVRSARSRWLFLLPLFRMLAGLLLVAALARPQVRDVQKRFLGNGISIVLCMDVSGSMATPDIAPYRLAVAKEVAMEFVRARPVDQIGLVVFAGETFTQFPISTDHEALLEQIRSLRPDMLVRGTLIGEGLATSVARLNDVPGKSKVVVLLTDGSEEAPPTRLIDPQTAIGIAHAKGVKVYTIGLNSGGSIDVPGQGMRKLADIDEPLLQRMAQTTGGAYFRARDRQALEGIYARINQLEKSDVQVINRTRFHEEFHWFVLGALFFLLLEGLLRYTLFRTLP